ncbi:MAG: response regulator [Sedimentisphaerales bacterium]|nr:response regulator [Sedimentisphaerales bacterium]
MRALIVEDNLTNRQLLLKLLEPFGSCEVAIDGKEAVDIFRKAVGGNERIDLICMDVMMPEMDGYEALGRIRQIEQELNVPAGEAVKVVMTTAVDSPSSVEEAETHRCDGYLLKPIRKVKLYEELQRLSIIPAGAIG